jgi:hypothetical protein
MLSSVYLHAEFLFFQQQLEDFLFLGFAVFSSSLSMIQQHEEFSRPRKLLITAAAHPTPTFTWIASAGQLRLQAPHSIQASLFTIVAQSCTRLQTARGQTCVHIPHPTHLSASSSSVTTFSKYMSSPILSPKQKNVTQSGM